MKIAGRNRDIASLRRTRRAAAVGRLLLGELKSWNEFLQPETAVFKDLTRRDLRANKSRFRTGLTKEIKKFCSKNFDGMTEEILERLYLKVLERLGLEMPLADFQKTFAPLKPKSLASAPRHCTVVVSLWGLQTQFPEDMLSKDIIEAVRQLRCADDILQEYREKDHATLLSERGKIGVAIRTQEFASRACLHACFNLVEAALNGLAWDFAQGAEAFDSLSQGKKKLLEDGVFRDKLLKYPEIISGRSLWDDSDDRVRGFLEQIKPYRDALVHASPFSKPEKYGGHDKLEYFYRIDSSKAQEATLQTVCLLADLFNHVNGNDQPLPRWLEDLKIHTAPKA